jgi:hypothetical protein
LAESRRCRSLHKKTAFRAPRKLCPEGAVGFWANAEKLVAPVIERWWVLHVLEATSHFASLSFNRKDVYKVHKNWLVAEISCYNLAHKSHQSLAIRRHLKS